MLDPKNPPPPVRDFVNAAVKTDFDTMFRQVDWQASRAAQWARNLDSPYLPEDRAAQMIEQGFQEFEDVRPGLVQSQLGEIALHIGVGGSLRGATEDERVRVVEALSVPQVARTLPAKVAKRLDEWRARAAAVTEVWAAVTERKTYWLGLGGDGKQVLLAHVPDPPTV